MPRATRAGSTSAAAAASAILLLLLFHTVERWFVRRMVMRIRRIGRGPLTRRPPLPPRPPPHRPRLLQVNEAVFMNQSRLRPSMRFVSVAKGQRMNARKSERDRSKRSTESMSGKVGNIQQVSGNAGKESSQRDTGNWRLQLHNIQDPICLKRLFKLDWVLFGCLLLFSK